MNKLTASSLASAAAIALGASLLSTSAFAGVTALGTLDPPDAGAFSDVNTTGPVADAGTFDLTEGAHAALSATIAVLHSSAYTDGSLTLYEGSPFTGTLISSAPLAFSGSAYTASFNDLLGPGTYYAEITGTVNVPVLGVGGTVVTSNVPEPSTWAMLAIGFAALGYATFRQRKTKISMLAA